MKFENYNIDEQIKKNLAGLGFKRPTDIQFKSIPSILDNEDVLAIAQTGTGKTAAFAIPIVNKINSKKTSKRSKGVRCLVLVPTRELARQIGKVFNGIAKGTLVKTFCLYGGVEQDAQVKTLQSGVDVLIATPGRMFDLIRQEYLNLDSVDTFVLDEADHMLDLGFIDDITSIKKKLTKRHQTLFFSATINKKIKKLAFSQVKGSAIRIQISPKDPVSKNVSHYVMSVKMDDKRFFLENFVRHNPESKIIVFVRTRVRAERVAKAMGRVDIDTITIHGEKDQEERFETMERFRNGECNILIATDISARGIDVADVEFVINYDLPIKPENYIHRVGRTGRGMNKGTAISFCSGEEKEQLAEVEKTLNKEIEVYHLSKREYAEMTETQSKPLSLEDMLEEQEEWEKKKAKKNARRRAARQRAKKGK